MKLLALDTASAQCSVALLLGDQLLAREVATPREHASLLLPMIDALLAEAGVNLGALDGIAFGRGPGSFTGVRIAASATQGLAAGANLPVLPISDLRALAEAARSSMACGLGAMGGHLLACMDARMGELYWGMFDHRPTPLGEASRGEQLSSPDDLIDGVIGVSSTSGGIAGAAGMGLGAYPQLAARLGIDSKHYFQHSEPHAREIVRLAAFDLANGALWMDAAAAQPVYLRNKVVQGSL